MNLFEEMSLFDISLLSNLQKVVQAESNRIEEDKKLDYEIFNHGNCQCAGEAYEFSMEQRLKTEFKNNFLELGSELLIVGLYKQCEVYLKTLVNEYHSNKSNSTRATLCTLNNSLPFYNTINELRLINNCIKHSAVVSSSLSNTYPSWNSGDLLGNLLPVYERLVTDVRRYIKEHETYIKQYT